MRRTLDAFDFADLDQQLNDIADQDLGTIVSVLDGDGRYDDASALEVCQLRYDVVHDNWFPQMVNAVIFSDPLLLHHHR